MSVDVTSLFAGLVYDGEALGERWEIVLPDGRIQTIEGNSSNQVARRTHDATGDGALGYVTMS